VMVFGFHGASASPAAGEPAAITARRRAGNPGGIRA
jgi:hypothetical protein